MTFFDDVQRAFAGRYNVEFEIGEGGSARVFAAHDVKHDRRVAIKVLKADVANSIAADRFLREIRVDAGLQHPRILPLFDSGEVLGMPYFVMPFVEGATLRTRLQREKTLPVTDAVRIATQVAEALAYLHAKGLVHRDVKPENILLHDDHVWLADFGIVRALQDATTTGVTSAGMAIGTPAYMSPEQRLGSATIDGRSDQFSLAFVVYEMLVGHPPRLFERAATLATPSGQRLTPMRTQRDDVPPALDEVLARALQFDEDARWPSMRVFAEKLANAVSMTPPSQAAVTAASRPLRFFTLAVAAGAVLLASVWWANRTPATPLDALRVAVLPLAHEGDADDRFLDGDDCSRFLRDAIGRWTGIHHVDDMELRDVRARSGRPATLDDAMRMAKQLGAGLAVWGIVGPPTSATGSLARPIHLLLYDVARGTSKEEANGIIDPAGDLSVAFQQLADSLLIGTSGQRPTAPVTGSRNFLAVRAYRDGHRALDSFNLSAASDAFRRAAEADPRFGLAYLWLAWSTLWISGSDPQDWGAAASRALAVGTGLTARDSVHARALVSMRDKRFADACDQYRTLIAADRRDFAAWYGLGECLSSDVAVVRSSASKSGWQFRSSMNEAMTAYERAIELVPSFADAMGQRALQRISRWLFAQSGRYRPGLSDDSIRFAAWPSLAGDTLAFIPFEERAVFAESAGTRDASYQQALQRNRERVLTVVNRWVGLDGNNALALETLASAREANDEIVSLRRSETAPALSALAALRRARERATGETAIRLAATEVRLLLKSDRADAAARLADSLLFATPIDSAGAMTAGWMHSLAMLTGRAQLAIQWGRKSSEFQYRDILRPEQSVSPNLSAAAADAATFASLGAPADSTRAALARVERALIGITAPSLESAQQQYVEQPLLHAWPSLGPAAALPFRASAGNRWVVMHLALARGDTVAARRSMAETDASAARTGVGESAFELALANARIWLALHDTASATRTVANAVELVRRSGDQLVRRPTATASYVRLLVLRTQLAQARGDTAQARVWGSRAWTLWRAVDPMIAEQMQPIVRWRGTPLSGGSR